MAINRLKRPLGISIICFFGFSGAFFSLIYVFSPSLKRYHELLPAFVGVFVALRFISFVGIWHMKKWGVELLAVTYFVFLLLGIFLKEVYPINYPGLAFSTWFLIHLLFYYRRMDSNL